MREVRCPSRPCFPRRSRADGAPLLHQLRRPSVCEDVLGTAGWATARRGLHGTHKCTEELAIYFRRERVDIDPFSTRNSRTSSTRYTRCAPYDPAPESHARLDFLSIFRFFERARDTAKAHISTLLRMSAGISPFVTTSDTANRPPGFHTRNASLKTR